MKILILFLLFQLNLVGTNQINCGDNEKFEISSNDVWVNLYQKGALDVSEMSEELICELSHNDLIIDAVLMPPAAQEMHPPDQSGKTSAKLNDEVDTMAVEHVKQQKNNKLPVIKSKLFKILRRNLSFSDKIPKIIQKSQKLLERYSMVKYGIKKIRENDMQLASMLEKLSVDSAELKKNFMTNEIISENRISVIKLTIANIIDKMATKVGVNLSEIKPLKFKNRSELFKSMLQLFKYTNEKNHLMEKEMVLKIFGFAKSILESTNKPKRHKRELGTILFLALGIISVIMLCAVFLYNCCSSC